jgi:hypothetical protein
MFRELFRCPGWIVGHPEIWRRIRNRDVKPACRPQLARSSRITRHSEKALNRTLQVAAHPPGGDAKRYAVSEHSKGVRPV